MRPILILAIAACSKSQSVPPARFAIAPPVRSVEDRQPTAKPPKVHEVVAALYHFDGSFYEPLMRTFERPPYQRAIGVNSLDEVPDSTWFTNRIGAHELTLDELRKGPTTIENPDLHTPWLIQSVKSKGESLGFTITDARNEKFLIKFDRVGFPELETSNHMITGRILWACGYNVPEDFISHINERDLAIAPGAIHHHAGKDEPLLPSQLAEALSHVEHDPDGKVRVLASRVLPGKLLGGHTATGRRLDDPNDRIPHELRRDLRGARPIFAWLDHADVKDDNTLDVWTDGGYVVHYFLDFGKSLGALAAINNDPRRGYEYSVDFPPLWGSLISLGLVPRRFIDRRNPRLRGVGLYDAVTYDPAEWHADTPAYLPFVDADRLDWYWGAKIMMRFTREQLRAIIETGELSDPRAAYYLLNTLITRQRQTAEFAFHNVNPVDNFQINQGPTPGLCFDDLLQRYQLTTETATYTIRSFDRKGRALGPAHASKSLCTGGLDVSRAADGYTIVRIEGHGHSVFVHIAKDPLAGEWHVIGVYRP